MSDIVHFNITQRSGKSQKGRETLNHKNRHRSLKKANGGKLI